MSAYPNLNKDPDLLKIKIKDDEIIDLKYKTGKHDHKNILKSPTKDEEYLRRKVNPRMKIKYC